ncbi:divalent cation tolerance protein CutA [Halobaculum sp. MBLA0147]|uniref:divalent cation tolerance protein CutA n=1 Tax=Halobaculum sp. MBLA0147 TaxID=3079934 RepID=UPI003525C531
MATTHLAVEIAVPDEELAERLAERLVATGAAAGTRTSSGPSHYRWEGTVERRVDWTVTAFTTRDRLDAVYDLVDDCHPDDLPGVTYRGVNAREEFRDWIERNTGPDVGESDVIDDLPRPIESDACESEVSESDETSE